MNNKQGKTLRYLILFTAVLCMAAQTGLAQIATYALEVGGTAYGYFTGVSDIGSTSDVTEQKVTDPETGTTFTRKIPGRITWHDVTLIRGITANTDLWNWRQLVADGDVASARKNCSIFAYNEAMEVVAQWDLANAWPSAISAPVSSLTTNTGVESIIIVCEGITRVL